MRCCLAIDIGASSGRHIVGWKENGAIQMQEVYRFPNQILRDAGHLVWDMEAMLHHVKAGISEALRQYPAIESLAIDTWGVDYVLLKNDTVITPVYAYRDSRTEHCIPQVHARIPFPQLYRRTGCQFQPFNTIYQLYADMQCGRLNEATDLLMMPEYLLYALCGVKAREYTNATTTGLVHAQTGEYDTELIDRLGYPRHLFPKLQQPGTVIGTYRGINCMLCATHDTASAVEGIPMKGNHPYISSGTWSLLGVKTPTPLTDAGSEAANYSNEGGIGYNRYQKNIMGMWLVNELQRELCPNLDFHEMIQLAENSACEAIVDANAPEFLAPKSMKAAFDKAAKHALVSTGDYFRCACKSLAFSYKQAIQELEQNTGITYEKLYVVGGGAKNAFLNSLIEEITGKQVVALPIEATALGNLKIQLEAI